MSEIYFSASDTECLEELEERRDTFEQETGTELPFDYLDGEWRYDGASVCAAVDNQQAFYSLNGGGQNKEDLAVLAFVGQHLREAGYEEVEAELNGAWKELR